MIIIHDPILQQVEKLREVAAILRSRLDDKQAKSEDLLGYFTAIDDEFHKLTPLLKAYSISTDNPDIHVALLKYYINDKTTLLTDDKLVNTLDSLRKEDMDDIIRKYKGVMLQTLDAEFSDKILSLFYRGNYEPAVYIAFMILNDRLKSYFGITEPITGIALIDYIFKDEKLLKNKIDSERQASIYHLMKGLYGLFYREMGEEKNSKPDMPKARAALHMIHWVLIELINEL